MCIEYQYGGIKSVLSEEGSSLGAMSTCGVNSNIYFWVNHFIINVIGTIYFNSVCQFTGGIGMLLITCTKFRICFASNQDMRF